jgi:hypothetical protein
LLPVVPAQGRQTAVRESALLSGDEAILPGVTVLDFWAWALGDLRLNANRGLLAQFLVAKALGDARERDDGWGNFDVLTTEGIKVEVKSSGYLQSWKQTKLSTIVFSGLNARSWDADTGYSPKAEFRADVYVFAVHTCQDPSIYDPLQVSDWDFYVLPAATVKNLDQRSIRLSRLQSLASPPTTWAGLQQAVLDTVRLMNR